MKKLIWTLGFCLALTSASAFAACNGDCDHKNHKSGHECTDCVDHKNCDAECHDKGHKHEGKKKHGKYGKHRKNGKKGKKADAAAEVAPAPAAPAEEGHSH